MESNGSSAEAGINGETEFLIGVETGLTTAEKNIYELIQNIPQTLANYIVDCNSATGNLEETKPYLPLVRLFPQNTGDVANKEQSERIASLERKVEELQVQLEKETEAKSRLQTEVDQLREVIVNESTYCASLGAVLGILTWRASRLPQIVDAWLSMFQTKVGDFLKILNGSFISFVNTYENALPPCNNVEYQFMFGLLGIVTNITASPEGREFLITNVDGKEFVHSVIKLLPNLPESQGTLSLKRLMLMVLYNVSMNKTGLEHLLQGRVGSVLNYCLKTSSLNEKMQLLCLRILQSITYDLSMPEYIRDLNASVSIEMLQDIASSGNDNLSTVAKQVIEYLRTSQKFLTDP